MTAGTTLQFQLNEGLRASWPLHTLRRLTSVEFEVAVKVLTMSTVKAI